MGPLPQDPAPKKELKFRELPPISLSKPTSTPQEAPKEKPMTMGGFLENTFDDAWDTAKQLYEIVPSLAKRVGEIVSNPGQYGRDVDLLFSKNYMGESLGFVWDGVTENYRKYGVKVGYHKPVSTTLDALMLVSGVGGATKQSGKIALSASGGIEALKRGVPAAVKAKKMIDMGIAMERLPGRLIQGAIDKGVRGMSGGKWDLAKRRDFLHLKREAKAIAATEAQGDVDTVLRKIVNLPAQEKALFHQYRALGVMPDELAKTPKLQEALTAWTKLVGEEIQPYYKARGLLDDARMAGALEKKYALEKYGTVAEDVLLKARAELKALKDAGGILPVWAPNVFEGKMGKAFRAEDVVDDLLTGGRTIREGRSGSLEAMKGARGYSKDPVKYIAHAIHGFRRDKAKLTLSERLLENQKLITGKGAPARAENIIPEGLYRKYYEDRIRAEALQKITDPTIQRLLKWEYVSTNHGAIRLYDAFHRLFSKMATKWNPRWYYGQVIGDAVLGELAGQKMLLGRKLTKQGAMPPEVLAKMGMYSPEGIAEGVKNGVFEKAADIAQGVDQLTRAGIVAKEAMRQLMDAGYSFERAAEMLPAVLKSTRQFSELQVELRLLREAVARRSVTVQKYDKVLARLKAREEKAALSLKTGRGRFVNDAGYPNTKLPKKERVGQKEFANDPTYPNIGKGRSASGRALDDLRQKIVNLDRKREAIVGDITSDTLKIAERDGRIPALQQQVDIARQAVDRANAFIGEYLGLDGFEQGVLRRVIPFYPWTKAMTMLAFRLPFLSPVKGFLWHRYAQMMGNLVNDPNMPDQLRGYVPVAALEDGRLAWVKATSFSPFEGLRTTKVADIPVPAMFNIAERNPILGLAFAFHGGKTVFNVGAIPYGTPAVMIHDGSVARVTDKGYFKEEIPQQPLVSGIAHLFPVTQYIQSVITPYWTNRYDWLGFPQPILNPDGTYRYPRELHDRLAHAAGIPLMTRSKEDWQRSERVKVISTMKALQKAYRRADPEERAMIKEAFEDYRAGQLRKYRR